MRIRLATHGGLQRCPDMNAAQLPVIWPFVLVQVSKRNANRPSLAVALDRVIASLLQRREARGDDFGIEGDGHVNLVASRDSRLSARSLRNALSSCILAMFRPCSMRRAVSSAASLAALSCDCWASFAASSAFFCWPSWRVAAVLLFCASTCFVRTARSAGLSGPP